MAPRIRVGLVGARDGAVAAHHAIPWGLTLDPRATSRQASDQEAR